MLLALVLAGATAGQSVAGATAGESDAYLDQTQQRWEQFSQKVWQYAETALHEEKSARLFEETLEAEGFKVERGVGDLSTAFIATAGKGDPVVAILAEYD